jgi:hypothetical protein
MLNSVVRSIEKEEDDNLEVLALTSGSWGWERLDAGQFNYNYDNDWITRDYETSHKEDSVINNFLNHPAAFYLFVDYNGIERGYARGHVSFDEQDLFVKCEALHAKPHPIVRRNPNITYISEVALIGGLICLSNFLKINEIRWGSVGIARKYGLQTRKRINGKRKSYFGWEIPEYLKIK